MNINIKDVLSFKVMITPMIVQILFWICVVLVVFGGLAAIFSGSFIQGLLTIVLGPLAVRIYAELILIFFKMNQGIQDLNNKP